ncbi:dihydrofolate reductase [Aerococcus sanguinicola]|uniref:Dihydrofolate reductase n=4 Tax=Aerococcus sanguinicola TaxID=119206 RepID=A0A0X8FCH1_9LACT|nr:MULTISPECIES: dihydrofolate reductase [Aerococcus]AMB94803.1 dihydrofolate reductase [Aerococcus sanguinicola]MDK7049574.1 dihydrofolate reductase [Aerococcus sanguinicola]OFT96347.1 dihydrofolate reductase [Aerococcus sp. HMSC23C02]PKZ23196.1 dihydrofolate reductase [Aerococcus sanguinicola]
MLIAVWAQARNGVIGKDQKMPWHLPNDFQFFRSQTMYHKIVLGRKTFEGMGSKPLPDRQTYILTRSESIAINGDRSSVELIHAIDPILELAKKEDVYIIGGKQIYQSFWPYLDELRVTYIDHAMAGDTVMDPDLSDFHSYAEIKGAVDDKNPYPHRFIFYRREAK